MEIDKIRFLLACYCCFSPVRGKLIKTNSEPISDTEIATLLRIDIAEWLNKKDQVLLSYFCKDDNGTIGLNPVFESNLRKIMENRITDPEIIKIVDEICDKFVNKLLPHQILIEHYKKMKGFDKQPDWDRAYFSQYTRIASNIIKKIGLETAIRVCFWMEQKYGKRWNLKNLLNSYQYYWQDINQSNEINSNVSNEYIRE